MCPIETPEGPNIGLIGSLSTYARINAFGFVETPYRKVVDGKVTRRRPLPHRRRGGRAGHRAGERPAQRRRHLRRGPRARPHEGWRGRVRAAGDDVDYMDVAARQMVSAATAMIPFLEHDDANRALMGSNMQRQAVPLVRPRRRSSAPAWSTGPRSTPVTWSAPRRPAWSRRSRPTRHRGQRRRHLLHVPRREVPPLEPGHVLQPAHQRRRG